MLVRRQDPRSLQKTTKTQSDEPFKNLRQNWCDRNRPIPSCRQAPIRDLLELESHLQSATLAETHHHAKSTKETTQFWSKNRSSSLKEHRETIRWVHSTIWIKIQQVPLNLTCCNSTMSRDCLLSNQVLNNSAFPTGSETRAPPGEQRGGISDSTPNT